MFDNKPNYYSIIPATIRYDLDLVPNAKLLYAEITSLTNKNGVCWAGDQYFMSLYEVKRQTIQRWLKQLEDKGFISREVVYKEGTKEIEKRFIRVYTQMLQGYAQNSDKGIHNIVTVNTTSTNTTSKNSNTIVDDDKKSNIPYKQIIDHLNEKANKKFRNSEGHKKHIRSRWKEGFTLEDFKTVIDIKSNEWVNDPKFNQYLRPVTLFGNKMDQYLNQDTKGRSNEEALYRELLAPKD